jgi:ribonuclease Z
MGFSVTILGNSSAKPTPHAHPSSQVVNLNEQYYLVDAGEGVQQQLIRRGINPLRLRAVFISHLHGDHCFGLFPLIATLGLEGKRTPLDIYAPAPMGEILEYHRRYFWDDLPYEVKWHEVRTTEHAIIMQNNTLEVWSIPLRHRVPTAGYSSRRSNQSATSTSSRLRNTGSQ